MADRDYDFRVLPIELIDPPELPMRVTMDDAKLEELAADIKRNGLLQPIGVYVVEGPRYRIIYGHRRYVSCELAGERKIPCFVHADGQAHEEDRKLSENRHREDVNAGDEGLWYLDLLTRRCGDDVDRLCELVGAKRAYVEGRLELAVGDEQVLAELRAGRIAIGIARELNKFVEDDWRRFYLAEAIEHGATIAAVMKWRIDRDRTRSIQSSQAAGATLPPTNGDSPIHSIDTCPLCMLDGSPLEMDFVRVHRDCLSAHLRAARAALTRTH